jgi:hypothetical protein
LFYDPRVDSFANMTHREQIWRKSFEGAAADERKGWYVEGRLARGANKTTIIARKLKRSVGAHQEAMRLGVTQAEMEGVGREADLLVVKGQIVPQDERSSENCLHRQINDVLQQGVAEQEKVNVSAFAAHLEEDSTWFYVIDCLTCKAVVPFKHAPEDEPIVPFPAMNVRCFHCHTDHTYAADLISRRRAAAPVVMFEGDRPSSDEGDGDREASPDRKDDCGEGGSGVRVILDRAIIPISSSLRRNNILNVAVSEKTATIFFLSSCFFAAGWVSQLVSYILYPPPVAVLNELCLSGQTGLLGPAFFRTVLPGLALFLFGIGSLLVESFAFKRRSMGNGFFRSASYIVSLARHATGTAALFLTETWRRKFSTRPQMDERWPPLNH